MGESELLALLEKSRRFNEASDITGILLYGNGHFIQILEGNEEALRALCNRISTDSRHYRMIVISEGEVAQREFPQWSMGFKDMTGSKPALIPGFTAYMDTPNQDEAFLNQSVRYRELLEMFRSSLV